MFTKSGEFFVNLRIFRKSRIPSFYFILSVFYTDEEEKSLKILRNNFCILQFCEVAKTFAQYATYTAIINCIHQRFCTAHFYSESARNGFANMQFAGDLVGR